MDAPIIPDGSPNYLAITTSLAMELAAELSEPSVIFARHGMSEEDAIALVGTDHFKNLIAESKAEWNAFLKSGSEVTTAAARIARGYTGRDLILNCGYRGWADGWSAESRAGQGGIPACVGEAIVGLPRYDLDALAGLLDAHKGEVAAVFMDAIAYPTPPPDGYLEGVRALCDKHEVLLAFDEIVTGFRMAPGGAQDRSSDLGGRIIEMVQRRAGIEAVIDA